MAQHCAYQYKNSGHTSSSDLMCAFFYVGTMWLELAVLAEFAVLAH
ncbi:MAG: hypothetical protein R3Y32_04245 [Bacillota bacterium]